MEFLDHFVLLLTILVAFVRFFILFSLFSFVCEFIYVMITGLLDFVDDANWSFLEIWSHLLRLLF